MNRTTLSQSTVTGFFSLPSPSLAEHNPSAYNTAMAGAPVGAGSCAYCGTGIRHHVVILTPEGTTHFIGTDCASKIGGDVARCAGARLTSEQAAARDVVREARQAEYAVHMAAEVARKAERAERFADALSALHAEGTEFHASLADQLTSGSLSWKQAKYVTKSVFGRRNKKNAEAFDALEADVQG